MSLFSKMSVTVCIIHREEPYIGLFLVNLLPKMTSQQVYIYCTFCVSQSNSPLGEVLVFPLFIVKCAWYACKIIRVLANKHNNQKAVGGTHG